MKTIITATIITIFASAGTAAAQDTWKPDPNYSYKTSESAQVAVSRKETYFGANLSYSSSGATITSMIPYSPAHNYHFKVGDVINSIGGIAIGSKENFDKAMETLKAGETIKVNYTRKGVAKDKKVVLENITVIKEADSK